MSMCCCVIMCISSHTAPGKQKLLEASMNSGMQDVGRPNVGASGSCTTHLFKTQHTNQVCATRKNNSTACVTACSSP